MHVFLLRIRLCNQLNDLHFSLKLVASMVSEGKGQERQRSCEEEKQNLTHCIVIQNSC